jgi:hypothetical protein
MRCYEPIWKPNLKRSKHIMAESHQIAEEIVVAWLSRNDLSADAIDTTKTGERIAQIYEAVLQVVQKEFQSPPPRR